MRKSSLIVTLTFMAVSMPARAQELSPASAEDIASFDRALAARPHEHDKKALDEKGRSKRSEGDPSPEEQSPTRQSGE